MLKTARSTVNVNQITGVLPVANGGTGVATSTGTGNTVLSAAPTLSGNVTFSTGNVIIGTSGRGIDFSANPNPPGMTSELLNDYEEGTFTPTVAGSSTIGTATYSQQQGTYTKVGRLVTYSIWLNWSGGTGAGILDILGLPFNGTGYGTGTVSYFDNIVLTAGSYCNGGLTYPSDNRIRMFQSPTGGGAASTVSYDSAGQIIVSGQYFA